MVLHRNTPGNTSALAAATLLAAGLLAGAATAAQTPSQVPQANQPAPNAQAPQTAPQAAPHAAVDDKEIAAFATANGEIQQLKRKWIPKVQAAAQDSPTAQQQVERQAYAEMSAAVEKNGLSVDKYNQILAMAQANPEFGDRVQRKMQPNQ